MRKITVPNKWLGTVQKTRITLYRMKRYIILIWDNKKRKGKLYTYLRRQGRKYRKRGSEKDTRGIIVGRIGIEKRLEVVAQRNRFGDLEVDLIIGANHKEAILTINDSASGMLKMKKVTSKEAVVVTAAISELLEEWIPS